MTLVERERGKYGIQSIVNRLAVYEKAFDDRLTLEVEKQTESGGIQQGKVNLVSILAFDNIADRG